VGASKNYEGFTFLQVFEAGRISKINFLTWILINTFFLYIDMVPMDQPVVALELLRRFVNGIPF
jgi:hypothetical protein